MHTNEEARLASALSDELSTLTLLESFKNTDQAEVTLSLYDKAATNHANAIKTLERRIEALINNEIVPIIETIVANQRERVSTARKALLDLMFNGGPGDADAPALTGASTAQQVNVRFGDLEGAVAGADGGGEDWFKLPEGRCVPSDVKIHRGDAMPEDITPDAIVMFYDQAGLSWKMRAENAYWGSEGRLVFGYKDTGEKGPAHAGLETEGVD